MKLLESKKFKLPVLYLITDRAEVNSLPVGVPYTYGDVNDEPYLVKLLEYEVLLRSAIASGYPFNFKKILEDNGYKNLKSYWFGDPPYIEFKTDEGEYVGEEISEGEKSCGYTFDEFTRDTSCVVHVDKIKELNIIPVWLDTIEQAVSTNIQNFSLYNPYMYNKKLGGMYGEMEPTSPKRNLIIIDISGSIPKACSSTALTLGKTLSESFYADLLITGSKSTLYDYSEIPGLNVQSMYDENGMDNDQVWFKNLVSGFRKEYGTVICFGDNHSPGQRWSNQYNTKTSYISDEDGKALCEWSVDKLISFHTRNRDANGNDFPYVAGYASWFEPKETIKISNWVTYLQ
jgi:hypothetical protein